MYINIYNIENLKRIRNVKRFALVITKVIRASKVIEFG